MSEITVTGKTVQEAINKAIKKLGLRRDQIEVHIQDEGKKGFLGIGAKPATVLVIEKRWGDKPISIPKPQPKKQVGKKKNQQKSKQQFNKKQFKKKQKESKPPSIPRENDSNKQMNITAKGPQSLKEIKAPTSTDNYSPEVRAAADLAKSTLSQIFSLMGVSAKNMSAKWTPSLSRITVEFESDSTPTLIGKDGATLEAIQYLVTLILGRKANLKYAVQIDTANYWKRIEQKLLSQVDKALMGIKRTGKPFRLNPMPSQMRRFVHKILLNHPNIKTTSEGEGRWRKVVLSPKNGNNQ
jgi:spoIIIJ-associated protein